MGFGKKLKKTVKAVSHATTKLAPLTKIAAGFVPGGTAILKTASLAKSLVAKPKAQVQQIAEDVGIAPINTTNTDNRTADVSNDLKTIASAGTVGNTGVQPEAFLSVPLAVAGPQDSANTKIPLNSQRPVKLRKMGNKTVMYLGIGALALIGIFVIARRK